MTIFNQSKVAKLPLGIKAVYYLFRRGRLVYIGASRNLLRRLVNHDHEFTTFSYRIVGRKWLRVVESKEIKAHNPPLNQRGGCAVREHLTVTVDPDIRAELQRMQTEESLNVSNYVNRVLRTHFIKTPRKASKTK